MFNLILENDKNKIFKIFNIFLLVLFAWVIFINTSYFIEKIIFGEHDHFYDLKLVHNSLIGMLNGEDIYKIYPPYYDQPRSAFPPPIIWARRRARGSRARRPMTTPATTRSSACWTRRPSKARPRRARPGWGLPRRCANRCGIMRTKSAASRSRPCK